MDRLVQDLRRFEAQNPRYGWRLACRTLGWSRSKFQEVLRELRLRSGQGVVNTPVFPENGGNQPWIYRSTADISEFDSNGARTAMLAFAHLAVARAFFMSAQNGATAAGNIVQMRRYRRMVRYATFVMEEIREMLA